MQQGDWANLNEPYTPNGGNVYTGASEITIAAEDDQTPGGLLKKANESSSAESEINNESSAGANKKTIIRVEGIM